MWWSKENKSFVFARQLVLVLLSVRLTGQHLLFLTNMAAALY
jgi:hypothetical protein